MRYWETLKTIQEGPFTIIVDKSWEDISIRGHFDETCYDIDELERKVNEGIYDWFMLRARVITDDTELSENIIGGFLYENVMEVFNDGIADDIIHTAKVEARLNLERLQELDTTLLSV